MSLDHYDTDLLSSLSEIAKDVREQQERHNKELTEQHYNRLKDDILNQLVLAAREGKFEHVLTINVGAIAEHLHKNIRRLLDEVNDKIDIFYIPNSHPVLFLRFVWEEEGERGPMERDSKYVYYNTNSQLWKGGP